MKDDLKNSKDVDNDNEDINKYFEMDCDKSFSSYGNNDNDSQNTFNYEEYTGEDNNQKNHNQIDDYINNNINNNLYNNEINNNNIINSNSNLINNPNNNNTSNVNNFSNNYNNMSNINKSFVNNNSSSSFNNPNNNNNTSENKTISNINNLSNDTSININNNESNTINVKYYNKNKIKKNEEEMDDLFFPNISKNDKNKNKNKNNIINNNLSNSSNKEKSGETKIVENLSLSSSSNNDIQIVSSEDFRKHFQEDRFGPQRKIEVVETNNITNLPFSQYHDKMKSKRNINKDYNKCFDAFFIDDKNKNINKNINQYNNNKVNDKSIGIQQKNYNSNSPNKDQNNNVMNKRKKFSPLPKNKYRNNNIFHKLLINRLEKQILTDIYDEYQNKEDFDETYYHIENIKNILNQKGVEEAISYLNTIEPISLREKIIMESTFFFKQIVKEEIEFAENNDGRLILYKQPDYLFNQNTKHITPLSGRVNQNFGVNKRGRSFKFGQRYMYNNNYNTMNNSEYGKEDFNYSLYNNNFNKNPFMYKSQNIKKSHK